MLVRIRNNGKSTNGLDTKWYSHSGRQSGILRKLNRVLLYHSIITLTDLHN